VARQCAWRFVRPARREAMTDIFGGPERPLSFQPHQETGLTGFFSHKIQFGASGTYFDYVADGGQDIWFPFRRLSGDILIGPRHRLVFLYQPIDVRTEILLSRDIAVDEAIFKAGTPMELRYGFDFYRLSYLFDFVPDPRNELAAGASLQVRDAVITFAAKSGGADQLRTEQGIGPVPALKFRLKRYLTGMVWVGSEIDGVYAAGKGATGSTEVSNDFVGALLDASVRGGFSPKENIDVFLNVRYLGGGAEGTQTDDTGPGDGYTKNWLHAYSVALGLTVR
jgi:hypothetical protein